MAKPVGVFALAAGAASDLRRAGKTAARAPIGTPIKPPPTPPPPPRDTLPNAINTGGFKAVVAPKTPTLRTQKQRRAYLDSTINAVHSGDITEEDAEARLRQAGFPDSRNPFAQSHGLPGPIQGIKTALTPRRHGVLAAQDTARAQAGVPNAGIVAPGSGLLAQVLGPVAQGAVYGPGGVVQAVIHPGRTGEQVGRNIVRSVEHPNLANAASLAFLGYAGAAGAAAAGARLAGASRALGEGAGIRAAVGRSSAEGGSLLHTPAGKPVRITVLGPEPRTATGEVAQGPREGFTVERPVSRNALVRPIQRARGRAIQRGVDKTAEQPGVKIGRFHPGQKTGEALHRTVSARTTVARELRANRRVEDALANATPVALLKVAGKLNRGEHAAVSVAGIAGERAFTEPAAAVGEQIATHQRYIDEEIARAAKANEQPSLTLIADNERRIADLKLAQNALENPSARLKKAAALAKKASDETTQRLIAAGHLNETTAAERVNNIYRLFHGGRYEKPTPGKLGRPSQSLIAKQARVDRLQALVDRAEPKVRAAGEKVAGTEMVGLRAVGEGKVLTPKGGARYERLSAALSQAKEELASAKAAAAKRVKPTGFQGADDVTAPPGAFYFPLSRRYQPTAALPSGYQGMSPGPFGMAEPRPGTKVPGLGQTFTGSSVAKGQLPVDSALAVGIRSRLVNNLLATERQYADLWKIASDEKRSLYDIPIRDTPRIRQDLRDFFRRLADTTEANPEQAVALTEQEVKALTDLLSTNAQAGVGESIEGVRWIDSRYLYDLGQTLKGHIWQFADFVNNPIRITQLYLRPAYILNLAGNLGMNGISEGVRVFPALRQAAAANRLYGDEATRLIDAGMGVSLSRSYAVGTGVLHRGSQALAEAWNGITDMHSRRAAFFSQAAREGFKSDAQIKQLLTDPKLAATRNRVFRIANKNIVDYGSLTPFEQNELRRLIYFYPWVSRGTIWALRTLVENPGKSFTLFQLGQIGAQNAHRALGKHLSWAEQQGLIPVGNTNGQGDLVSTVNPSSVYTPTTAVQAFTAIADTLKAAAGLPHGTGVADVLTPSATLLTQAATRSDAGSSQKTGLPGIAQGLPFVSALTRAGVTGKPSKAYPTTGIGQALGPLAAGGLFPRPTSRSALAKSAVTNAGTPRAKASVQIDQLLDYGIITPEKATRLRSALRTASPAVISSFRRQAGPVLKAAETQGTR